MGVLSSCKEAIRSIACAFNLQGSYVKQQKRTAYIYIYSLAPSDPFDVARTIFKPYEYLNRLI